MTHDQQILTGLPVPLQHVPVENTDWYVLCAIGIHAGCISVKFERSQSVIVLTLACNDFCSCTYCGTHCFPFPEVNIRIS